MDYSEYCREIETHLCRKNDGHLIRIVGPAFEQVCSWAARGVPLKIALRGIDRYFERYYAKGPRRRPVRVEFCEDDILDLFDDWRRAVGVAAAPAQDEDAAAPAEGESSPRKPALAAHIDRAIARLLASGRNGGRSPRFSERVDRVVEELGRLAGEARRARGDARARIIERLSALNREILTGAVEEIDAAQSDALKREAESELAPFGTRMAAAERERAGIAAFHRLVRESLDVPSLEYE